LYQYGHPPSSDTYLTQPPLVVALLPYSVFETDLEENIDGGADPSIAI
jgi:hypothetical protein